MSKFFVQGEYLCVVMYDYFDYHGHMCIAFELLGNINNNSFTKYFFTNAIQGRAYLTF